MKIIDKETGKVIAIITEDEVLLLDTKKYEIVEELADKLARISATQAANTDQALERILAGQ